MSEIPQRPPDDRPRGIDRRAFLGATVSGAGGVVLASSPTVRGVQAAIDTIGPPLPSGYEFHLLAREGFGSLSDVKRLLPLAMFAGTRAVIAHGLTDAGHTVIRLNLELDSDEPKVGDRRTIVKRGEKLHDGRVVDRIAGGDANRAGAYATVIQSIRKPAAVYLFRPGSGMRRVVGFNDHVGENGARFSARFGDLDLRDDSEILLVATYADDGGPREGLFRLRPRDGHWTSRLLLRSGRMLPGEPVVITGFGMIDADNHGNYIGQLYARQREQLGSRSIGGPEPTILVRGRFEEPRSRPEVLVASERLGLGRSRRGETYVAPRIRNRHSSHVVHKDAQGQALVSRSGRRRSVVGRTGDLDAPGPTVGSYLPPVIAENGLIFHTVVTRSGGTELRVTSGAEGRTLLETGIKLRGRRLTKIILGHHAEQVDRHGRLIFIAEFATGPSALVLGIPQ